MPAKTFSGYDIVTGVIVKNVPVLPHSYEPPVDPPCATCLDRGDEIVYQNPCTKCICNWALHATCYNDMRKHTPNRACPMCTVRVNYHSGGKRGLSCKFCLHLRAHPGPFGLLSLLAQLGNIFCLNLLRVTFILVVLFGLAGILGAIVFPRTIFVNTTMIIRVGAEENSMNMTQVSAVDWVDPLTAILFDDTPGAIGVRLDIGSAPMAKEDAWRPGDRAVVAIRDHIRSAVDLVVYSLNPLIEPFVALFLAIHNDVSRTVDLFCDFIRAVS